MEVQLDGYCADVARPLSLPLAVVLSVAAAAAAGAASGGGRDTSADPDRGALVYVSNGCGACHVFREAGSSGSAGPDLDRWPATHAARLRLPTASFVRARIAYGGRGMPPYTELTPEELDDLTSYVLGTPVAAGDGDLTQVPPLPAPPPLVTASPGTVKAWVKAKRLTGAAVRGAQVLAEQGCLSCHRFQGAGVRRVRAPDLSTGGPGRLSARRLRALIASPPANGSTSMPSYGDLGDRDLRALADLLVAVRR